MAIELVFRLREGDDEFLYWVSLHGEGGSGPTTDAQIDRDHLAQAKRTKEPGWVEAEPQVVLMPKPVEEAVTAWATRPSID